jgi:predicted nucleotidyltransferase
MFLCLHSLDRLPLCWHSAVMANSDKASETLSFLTVDQLKKRLDPLFHLPEIQLVVLFGSAASGALRADSDLDLAILGDHGFDLVALTNMIISLVHCNDVDLVDLRGSNPVLMMEVARTGVLLFERQPGGYVAFCSLAHRRYVDTAKLRTAEKTAIRQFLQARGLE